MSEWVDGYSIYTYSILKSVYLLISVSGVCPSFVGTGLQTVENCSTKDSVSHWGFDLFFGSFDLYQDKRNEHKGLLQNNGI